VIASVYAASEVLQRGGKLLEVIMERIQEAKADFRSLAKAIDTTTPAGRMMIQMVGSFAEFERAMLRKRTRVGLESARDEGRIGRRRPKLLPQQQTEVLKMVTQGKKTAADAARLFAHPAGCYATSRCIKQLRLWLAVDR
jgi:DNA invertase Pin-like site-specific DNA recombinase